MMILTSTVACVFLALAACPAGAEILLCKLRTTAQGNWIPPILAIDYDAKSGKAVVSDPIILYFRGGPIPANADLVFQVELVDIVAP